LARKNKMKNVVVFGNDHTNTVGVIQSLGKSGYHPVALLYGDRTGYVKSSRYTTRILSGSNENECIDVLLRQSKDDKEIIPIIACADSAALALNECKEELGKSNYVFEFVKPDYEFRRLFEKDLQVEIAIKSGFNVPFSRRITKTDPLPPDLEYPCIIKPLISSEGAKSDIRICHCEDDIYTNLRSLRFTKKVIIQKYIERDYEISILGCSKKDGECIIPAVENKLTLYPPKVGLECLADIEPLTDKRIIESINSFINEIGYVGLFSVEMMHCKTDGKYYFTEINLRNDGAQSFIYKYGVNLPLIHVCDLLSDHYEMPTTFNPGYYIWDMHHFKSLLSRNISLFKWYKEIRKSCGFLMYYKQDKAPFFRQYTYLLKKIFSFKHVNRY